MPSIRSNFDMLRADEEQLWRLGALAERYFGEDPNTSLLKLRQLTELLAQSLAARAGLYTTRDESQYELLRRLQDQQILPRDVRQIFDQVRILGNAANHALQGDHGSALSALKLCWQLALWFHRTFKQANYRSGPFLPPAPPPADAANAANAAEINAAIALRAELAKLRQAVADSQASHQQSADALQASQAQLSAIAEERSFWENMAAEAEQSKAQLSAQLAARQASAAAAPKGKLDQLINSAANAASQVQLDEQETRRLIDQQLRQAGWQADSTALRYGKGSRPQKNQFLAIAEWPCEGYFADYVLFDGLCPIAIVEAKRKNSDVSAALQQAKRYSRSFAPTGDTTLHLENWGKDSEYRIPFVFSANGRPYLRQLETKSGIWFCDLRQSDNLGVALDGWYTPQGLAALLKRDAARAHAELAKTPFDYGFALRDYQQDAILAAERAIANGQRALLLAMATGTGKTKTCIALIYRLLKAQRFHRVLFLVDRAALGEQAAGAFNDTRMENLQSFADTFGIEELADTTPATATKVHLATIQGMVQRVLYPAQDVGAPPVDQYDCIVVDECHRGYLLDRELSDTEMRFRGFDDYISKYRRVLDYFDAVKIGLTATPALHTANIFGAPIYSYEYREAVIDGYLVDYEPPYQIHTDLSDHGITWEAHQTIQVYDTKSAQIDLFTTPDEITLNVEDFNSKVITEAFNQAVCDYLAQELDPASPRKTLIFCINNDHADLLVKCLKIAFAAHYGSVDDDAVIKITGAADQPLKLIRRYKNEQLPNVAVTVDLLTTGIDVPSICNLVFLRQVGSRILFDQMMGRATRPCTFDDNDAKGPFRVFDAVRMFESIGDMTKMKPVVVDPKISFTQLADEIASADADDVRQLVREQFLAKLQSKKRHLSESAAQDFEALTGMPADAFVKQLKKLPLGQVAAWFAQYPGLGAILDRKNDGGGRPILISDHADALTGVTRGYGKASKPDDYLRQFAEFINSHGNEIPALLTVLTRPRELTRKQLKELMVAFDQAGFSETNLAAAWRDMTNQDIAARIVGYIRQAAIGDPLLPYGERVDRALQKLLTAPPGGKGWSGPQREWLKRIAAQTKANLVVDRSAIDDPVQIFQREGGGFVRLNKLFNGQLQELLGAFNDALWDNDGAQASA